MSMTYTTSLLCTSTIANSTRQHATQSLFVPIDVSVKTSQNVQFTFQESERDEWKFWGTSPWIYPIKCAGGSRGPSQHIIFHAEQK